MDIEQAFLRTVNLLENAVDKDGNALGMKSLFVSSKDGRFGHVFADGGAADLRSVSKVALALTVGIAADEGLRLGSEALSLETDVGALLQQSRNLRDLNAVSTWSGVKLAHLLSHTIGHDQGFFFRKDIAGLGEDELLPYVFSRQLEHEPGVHFAYSNVGYFIVSVLFQEFLGSTFGEVAGDLLLARLGITEYNWRKRGKYSAGCTGLELKPADLHRMAELVAGDGVYQGRPIAAKSWCEAMRAIFIRTPKIYDPDEVLPAYGYGYGLWICPNGSYYCWGTDGQYLIVVPDQNLVITTLADQADMKPITRCMIPLLRPT
jgi:CubicO group peptidase (beta-lactamase class C family)